MLDDGSNASATPENSRDVRELEDIPSVEVISRAAVMLMSAAAERLGLADGDVLLALPAAAAGGASGGGHYFLAAFFLPATCIRRGPLRVRALVFVRWPRTGMPRRWRSPR